MNFDLKDLIRFIEEAEESYPETKPVLETVKHRVDVIRENIKGQITVYSKSSVPYWCGRRESLEDVLGEY